MEGDELIRIWLDSIDRVSRKGFVPLADFKTLPDAVLGGTRLWSARFFTPEANPTHQTNGIKYSYHLSTADTPDLLRYEYEFKSLNLEVIESSSYTFVRVRQRPGSADLKQNERVGFINRTATMILNMRDENHNWEFQFPSAVADDTRFSTDPNADPIAMTSWESRADGGIRNGDLYFLLFKKIPDRPAYPDIQRWFDNRFRGFR